MEWTACLTGQKKVCDNRCPDVFVVLMATLLCVATFCLSSTTVGKVYAADDFGDGSDGAVTISSNKNIHTDTIASGRTAADGEAFTVSSLGVNTITVTGTGTDGTSSSSLSNSVSSGDEILLINLRGASSAYTNVGSYEFCEVSSVSGAVITCGSNLTKTYGNVSNTDLTGQSIVVQRVPNYANVTINSGVTLTANAWDGSYGGIVVFRSNGTVSIAGSIDMGAKGYRGGNAYPGNYGSSHYAYQGESINGTGSTTYTRNLTGGGGASTSYRNYGGGGGGGYATSGGYGTRSTQQFEGGNTIGNQELSKIYFGGGGGGSEYNNRVIGKGYSSGGIVVLYGSSFTSLNISADGTNSINGGYGRGGAGAGGSIFVTGRDISLGSVSAQGGVETTNSNYVAGNIRGEGGDGRIALYYTYSLSGTTSPTAYTEVVGNVLQNVESHITVVTSSDWSTDVSSEKQSGVVGVGIKNDVNVRIATFDVDFSDDRDWSDLSAASGGKKAILHYPGGFSSIPGASGSSYSLYVPKGDGIKVGICPNALSLPEVGSDCSGIYYRDQSDPNVEIVTEGGDEYWKISGLTGTGAFSLDFISDTLTRQQVGIESDHDIKFTTSYAVNSSGDTIVVDFVPGQSTTDGSQDFDFNGIDVGDIDLEDDGVDKTLCTGANPCSAGAGIWGVNISTGSNDTITFTAPTDAGATEIASGSIVHIKIGLNTDDPSQGNTQIKNPTTAGSYEIHIRLDNGSDIDFGELEVPIVDDDTINITSYLDTVLSFDIDTVTIDVDCDASGGASPCDSHSSASDDVGYVVDLGEMTLSTVNKSGDSVLHADGLTGNINYIWFDLESNADGGTVVTVVSANEELSGPGSNSIPSVATGSEQQISVLSGLYGLNHRSGLVNTTTAGSLIVHADCDCTSGDSYYCDIRDSEGSGTPIEVFNSNGNPVDDGRVQWTVGAAPDSDSGTGTYTDQLTFVATATF